MSRMGRNPFEKPAQRPPAKRTAKGKRSPKPATGPVLQGIARLAVEIPTQAALLGLKLIALIRS